jgi:vancomycin resistance protein YoaR
VTGSRPPRRDGARGDGGDRSGQARRAPARPPGRRARGIVIGAGAAMLVVLVLLIAGGSGGVAPGTTVAGVDMGADEAQARAALRARADQLVRRPITVRAGSGTITTVSPSQIGGSVDVDAAVRAAQDASPMRIVRGIKAITGQGPTQVALPVTYRKGALDAWVAEISGKVDRAEQNAVVTVRGTTFDVRPARAGREVDRAALRARVSGDVAALPAAVDLPLREPQPALTTAAAKQQVAQAVQVLGRGGAVVVDGVPATLAPRDIAAALRFTPGGLRIAAAELRRPLIAAYPQGSVVPRPARFDIRGTRAILVPSKDGRLVDGRRVADGLLGEDRPVESSFIPVTPVFTTAKAEKMGIKEEVGAFTTPYEAGQPRVTNIRRASEILNGTIIPPGGTLSLNRVLGKRTTDRGFVAAPMVADGLLVDAVGGGVSQLATTLFNAAFFAGFRLDEHTAHQLYFERYPLGREATISWPKPDLKVTNDWKASALVRVFNGSSGVTVAIYSTSFDRRVETETSERTDFTEPAERRVTADSVPEGQEVVRSEGSQGFSVRVSRKVFEGSRLKEEDVFTTTYLAPPKVILVPEGTPGAETPYAGE